MIDKEGAVARQNTLEASLTILNTDKISPQSHIVERLSQYREKRHVKCFKL